ncbi:hypothetical protein L3Q82_000022 [Scortum barcoo]|uniref:Uncharacterized protein n=1 Tax=Scortum barcoo TaxID=214431 RepID=A0ACB8XA43_9TELE|nr:hypothetical protein L3Q82_000022 [Scortum barcoo]
MLGEYSRGQTAPCSYDPFPSLIICPSSNQQGEVNLKEAKGKVLSALMTQSGDLSCCRRMFFFRIRMNRLLIPLRLRMPGSVVLRFRFMFQPSGV